MLLAISKLFSLPIKEPILIFSVILFIILFSPLLLAKVKIPSIIGLIIAGVAIGPNGFHLVENDSSFKLFGFVGLIYIMFLAGLELDRNEFRLNRNKSIVFGSLTFIIPLILGLLVCLYLLHYSFLSSLLIASMFSTHTLIAYPITSRLGISKHPTVNIAVGGTILTDTTVLILLSLITGAQKGELNSAFWLQLCGSILVFGIIVFYLFPRITRWFFKYNKDDKTSHYIFVMALVFLAAFLVELANIEPIVGAFMAGLALNRLIPHTSPLMHRIEFVGYSLFIPFFLISVGMLVDLRVIFHGTAALYVACILILTALLSKWLAAWFTQILFKFSGTQRALLFGLSSAHAAATLAIIKAGYDNGLIDATILNGTVLLILCTCLVASFVTERASKKMALENSELKKDELGSKRILIFLTPNSHIELLLDLSLMLKNKQAHNSFFALQVANQSEKDNPTLYKQIDRVFEKTLRYASSTEHSIETLISLEINLAQGVLYAINDNEINEVILEWPDDDRIGQLLFGNSIERILMNCEKTFQLNHVLQPLNTFKKIKLIVPSHAEYEVGFTGIIQKLIQLQKISAAQIIIYTSLSTFKHIENEFGLANLAKEITYSAFKPLDDFALFAKQILLDELCCILTARKGTISYQFNLDAIPKILSKYFRVHSYLLIYPEQNANADHEHLFKNEDLDISHIQENIARVERLSKSFGGIFKKRK